jgi:hypothetical protein
MPDVDFVLSRDAFGRLVLTGHGRHHERVVPVRAFPLAAPGEGVSLVAENGQEVAWIDSLDALAGESRRLIEEELASREFIPVIQRIVSVSSFATPSTWRVETDRGDTAFILRGEEDIRRFGGHELLVADSNGIQFRIRDVQALDRASRRILDRFL